MNIWALSTIMRVTETDVEKMYEMFETEQQLNNATGVINYTIKEEVMLKYLTSLQAIEPDVEVFVNLFRLIDNRGFGTVDIRDVLISVTILTSPSVPQCIERAILIMDRKKTGLLEKPELFNIIRLLNDTCYYFGDKYLTVDQVHDLVNSTYTTAGKIDGTIYYPNFIEFISTHPIVELFLSPQFQGNAKSKILTDEALDKFVYSDR